MVERSVKYTVRDYMNLPESEEKRYELIDGELDLVPSPTTQHQDIVGRLFLVLARFVQAGNLGRVFVAPLDVVLSEHDVLQPDLMYVSKERESIVSDPNVKGAPNMVVEVLSPATEDRDRTVKRARYLKYGVVEYWIVDPQSRTIEVLRAEATNFETERIYAPGTTMVSPELPGLEVDVANIFA